jgi:hypothetical protein
MATLTKADGFKPGRVKIFSAHFHDLLWVVEVIGPQPYRRCEGSGDSREIDVESA